MLIYIKQPSIPYLFLLRWLNMNKIIEMGVAESNEGNTDSSYFLLSKTLTYSLKDTGIDTLYTLF